LRCLRTRLFSGDPDLHERQLPFVNRSVKSIVVCLLVLASTAGVFVHGQQPLVDPTTQSQRRDMEELIKGQIELQKQVQDLKILLQGNQACAQSPPANIVLDVTRAPSEGESNAPVTMIEFSDFQCPFCARYNSETFPRIEQDYVQTGKVRYVFRDFPLQNIHPLARRLAEVAQCAFAQKQFWQMRNVLFFKQASLTTDEAILNEAKQIGIDTSTFRRCLHDGGNAQKVSQEIAEASANGVTGTPTFFLGRSDSESNKIKVLKVIVGQQPYGNFQQAIELVAAKDKNAVK
jgi:protein-disulfide isomerase